MTRVEVLGRLAVLARTRNVELALQPMSQAEMAALFGAVAVTPPGPGARLVVAAHDPRRLDDGLEALLSDTAGLTCSDRDYRDDEQTLPGCEIHDTDRCPPPEDE